MVKKRSKGTKKPQPRPAMELINLYLAGDSRHFSGRESKLVDECFATKPTTTWAADMNELVIIVMKLPQGLNSRDITHWGLKKLSQDMWDGIMAIAKSGLPSGMVKYPLLVEMTTYRVSLLDADNNAASAKQLIDAMVHTGIIANDDRPHIQQYISYQVKVPHKSEQHVVVRLRTIPAGYTVRVSIEKIEGT